MLLLKQPLILPFLYHKSATTGQIDSYKVSNSKLKPVKESKNMIRISFIKKKFLKFFSIFGNSNLEVEFLIINFI